MKLIYKGQILKDDQTLNSYGLQSNHTIYMEGAENILFAKCNDTFLDMPDMSQLIPVITMMMQTLLSSSLYMNQIIDRDQRLKSIIDSDSRLKAMVQNPEPRLFCQLASSLMMQDPGDELHQKSFEVATKDMKQSGFKEFDVKNLAEIFELRGKEAMQSKLYPAAIEYYNVAIAFGGDNAIYYCNRAAAYIQTCQYAEAILDCQKSIAIDPNYIKACTRLGYIYFIQGIGALEKGYRIATLLHPSVREDVRAAEHKIWQQREESGQDTRLRASAMDPSNTNPGELYEAIRADISFLASLHLKTNNSNEN